MSAVAKRGACVCVRVAELQSRKCHQSLVVDIDQRDRLFAAAHETRDWLFPGNASWQPNDS